MNQEIQATFPTLYVVSLFHTDIPRGKLVGVFTNPIKALEAEERLMTFFNLPKGDNYNDKVSIPLYIFDAKSHNTIAFYNKEVLENPVTFDTKTIKAEDLVKRSKYLIDDTKEMYDLSKSTQLSFPRIYLVLVHKSFVLRTEVVGVFTDEQKALETHHSLLQYFNLQNTNNTFEYDADNGVEICILENTDIDRVLNYNTEIDCSPHTTDFMKLCVSPDKSTGLWTSCMGAEIYKYLHCE
jgi:hypothetical protein